MQFSTLAALAAALLPGAAHAQSVSPARTPWHVSRTFEYTNDNLPGLPTGSGTFLPSVPNGYYYCVTNVIPRRRDTWECAPAGNVQSSSGVSRWMLGYVAQDGRDPRGRYSDGISGIGSCRSPVCAEGEKRLRSATRNP